MKSNIFFQTSARRGLADGAADSRRRRIGRRCKILRHLLVSNICAICRTIETCKITSEHCRSRRVFLFSRAVAFPGGLFLEAVGRLLAVVHVSAFFYSPVRACGNTPDSDSFRGRRFGDVCVMWGVAVIVDASFLGRINVLTEKYPALAACMLFADGATGNVGKNWEKMKVSLIIMSRLQLFFTCSIILFHSMSLLTAFIEYWRFSCD